MFNETFMQQIERTFRVVSPKGRRKWIWLLLVLSACLFCGCGQARRAGENEIGTRRDSETVEKSESAEEFRRRMERIIEDAASLSQDSDEEDDKSVTNEGDEKEGVEEEILADHALPYFPENDAIRESIYSYLGKGKGAEISEEEVEAAKGKLQSYTLTVYSGEEFALMREWYDWESVHRVVIHFSQDLQDWTEEELQALAILDDTVYAESDEGTFPARALTYLTGVQDLYVSVNTEVADVTGTLPDGAHFPKQIKSVTLHRYREGKFSALLGILRDSQAETLTVRPDYMLEELQGFWLDDVAGIGALKELVLEGATIRVREETALDGCGLVRIKGYIDKETDLCFVEKLAQLEEVESNILAERDLSPLLRRKEISLYLDFCRDTTASERAEYGGRTYTVCPAFNKAVLWPGEAGDERFLGLYQRRIDGTRIAECFTERRIARGELAGNDIYSFDPWIRVTDDSTSYEFRPAEEIDRDYAFGDARSDAIRFEDINFDGDKDIVLSAGHFGNQGLLREFGWIWNRKLGRYESSPAYYEIANPMIDAEHQLVRSSWRNSAASHSWAIYRYADGEFTVQSVLTEDLLSENMVPEELEAPEDAEVWRWQEEIYENGEIAEVKNSYAVELAGEETVYPEELEHYYAADSYWGSPYYHGNW